MAKGDNNDKNNPLKYGVLNPVDEPNKQRHLPSSDSDGPEGHLQRVSDVVRGSLFSGEISVDGEYNGVVLKKAGVGTDLDPDTSNNWEYMYDKLSEFGETPGERVYYYVRVPEIHAMNPIPKNRTEIKKIKLHDKFLDKSEDGIGVGDIVRVSFYNGQGIWMPYIIEKDGNYDGLYPESIATIAKSLVGHKSSESSGLEKGYTPKNSSTKGGSRGIKDKKVGDKLVLELKPPSEYDHYSQNRVRSKVYGTLPMNSDLAVDVKSYNAQRKLHKLAAKRFEKLRDAASEEGFEFEVISGLRRHRWNSKQHYRNYLKKNYESVAKGRRMVAFDSPHETGLAMDLASVDPKTGNRGTRDGNDPRSAIWPESGTISKQEQTEEFKWLKNNAYKFGFSPYLAEPWHWECLVPLKNWKNGNEFIPSSKDFSYRVHEYLRKNKQINTTQERIINHL